MNNQNRKHMRNKVLLISGTLLTAALLVGISLAVWGPKPETAPVYADASSAAVPVGAQPETEVKAQQELEQGSFDVTTVSVGIPAEAPGEVQLDVPYISQEGLLPTGCELVSALMALWYYGAETTIDDVIDHLEIGFLSDISDWNYDYAGPSPEQVFVGDPWSSDGFGCFPPVIVRMLNQLLPAGHEAVDTSGSELEAVAKTYLSEGKPVLLWVTIDMMDSYPGDEWLLTKTGVTSVPQTRFRRSLTGEVYSWPTNEHCMVLVGYDEDYYYLNDPYEDNGTVAYEKWVVEERFEELGKRAVAVV